MICSCAGVMVSAADSRLTLFEFRADTSEENAIGWTCTWKPARLPTSVTMSIIMPWIVLVLRSRKVNGMPPAVAPTRRDSAWAGSAPKLSNTAAMAARVRRARRDGSFTDRGWELKGILRKSVMPENVTLDTRMLIRYLEEIASGISNNPYQLDCLDRSISLLGVTIKRLPQ